VLRNKQVDHLGLPLYPRDRWGRVHSCPQPDAYCEAVGNPMYGLQHFDNVGGFIPSTLQLAIPDSAYSIIHQGLQSEPEVSVFETSSPPVFKFGEAIVRLTRDKHSSRNLRLRLLGPSSYLPF
jgi:hypothetical protein